ncbi:MAG: 4Fe-4S ferredoxin [Firmicutes bacterium HGW-Firmicutes-14]|jgi:carbon-monoxide dehydrogenase iron sulfur subunit|nr:MAG: 4Fe-4S ferredoxin [Firmicutes bacterium HGW-Firmicutes-14]
MKQILVDIKKCLACKSCEIACAVTHSESKSLIGAVLQDKKPRQRVYVEAGDGISFPLQCRHCEDPRCVSACMSGAMYTDDQTGLVANNPDKCVGCWMCVMVCPFGAITQDTEQKIAQKCERCVDLEEPACVMACPTKAIKFLDIDVFSKDARLQYLTNFHLKEEGK